MRVVLDTNVVASALLWGSTPRLLLQAACEKRIELFTSTAMLAELTDTAIAARADLLVTGDKPLLSVAEYQGVRAIGLAPAITEIDAVRKS